jgi:hypothetical protein
MKRLGFLFAFGLLGLMLAGCDSGGLQEGTPTGELPKDGMSESHRAYMEKNAGKMQIKGKPKNIPKAEASQ